MCRFVFIVILLLSPKLYAEELVAVLDLYFKKDTGDTAATLCFGEGEEGCGQWATFYLYEARIKKVLSGEFNSKKFKVIYGRHALLKKNLKGVVATLIKLPDNAHAEYQIIELGELREMYCFSGEYNMPYNVSEVTEGQQLKCFEEEKL